VEVPGRILEDLMEQIQMEVVEALLLQTVLQILEVEVAVKQMAQLLDLVVLELL
jgi:hypothetical protein